MVEENALEENKSEENMPGEFAPDRTHPAPGTAAKGAGQVSGNSGTSASAGAIEQRIKALFDSAREEIFEDGMENELSIGLTSLADEYGNDAIAVLSRFIDREETNEEIASEVIRWLGRLDHQPSEETRLRLIERCLNSSPARLRNAASVALAYLDDPHAIPYLKQAVEREKYAELREDMEQVLVQLEGVR
jgi:hypothetical protein